MIDDHLRIVDQPKAEPVRSIAPVDIFGNGDIRKGTNLVEIGPPERQIAGSGKMLLLDVEALAETDHRLICFQRSRYLGVLQCDPNIAAVDRAGAGDRKRVLSGKSVSVRVDLGGCRNNKK